MNCKDNLNKRRATPKRLLFLFKHLLFRRDRFYNTVMVHLSLYKNERRRFQCALNISHKGIYLKSETMFSYWLEFITSDLILLEVYIFS